MPPRTGPRDLDLFAFTSGDLVQGAPHRRRGGDRTQDSGLVAQDADVGDGRAATCEHHRDIGQHPATVMDRDGSALRHGPRQLGGQADAISQKTRRDDPGMSNHPDILDGERQTRRPRSTLHLPSAFYLGTWSSRQVTVSPVQEALRSICTRRSADPRESPGLGLLAGVGIALLITTFDRRVKSKEQLEAIAGKHVVGSIPFRKGEDKEKGAEHIVPFREGHSPAAESFRRLRTNLQFLNVDKPPRVFVLTSSVATEGKSETAINLSLALAESGSRVLLIEADLRRPLVVNYMSMPDKVGLTNILTGQADFADVVQETRHEGVDLLACGPLPPNPSELLSSEMARTLLQELRSKYDYVIIDSPPLLPVTDGALLAHITDGALLVVRSHRTTSDQVAQAVDNLAKADASLLGLVTVANKPAKKGSTGYYDSYYYSSAKPASVEA